ncbi:unnamed protein product [Darwinula stevensoni]|uniref:Repulsive guidance molecule A n=1 Tax=Darwinula stevensoni TaxID=69355 RepID=A0A7R8XBX6_9CRUS|nr:unnamed protein product [Darwinula stevensoni]CAG0891625.1 unnamed protein product [Darwinula stevensoni]
MIARLYDEDLSDVDLRRKTFSRVVSARGRCLVEQCSYEYTRSLGPHSPAPTPLYCRILHEYTECIRGTARSCRGDLQFHISSRAVASLNSRFNCAAVPGTDPPPVPRCTYDPVAGLRKMRRRGNGDKRHPTSKSTHALCALFGDPHLLTFQGEMQTCGIPSAWPLLDNQFLTVQVTSSPVCDGCSATAPTKVPTSVVVLVKKEENCTPQVTYEALAGASLPGEFVGGSTQLGMDGAVSLKVQDQGRHVEVLVRHAGTIVVIRRIGDWLSTSIRVPWEYTGDVDGLLLCSQGCPASQQIHGWSDSKSRVNLNLPQWRRGLAWEDVLDVCHREDLKGFFLDACAFDLLTTSDTSFATAARQAQTDYEQVHPGRELWNTTRLNPMDFPVTSGVMPPHGPGRPLFALLLVFLLPWLLSSRRL